MTGGDFLKSGCLLLRAGVDEVLGVVPQFAEDLLGAEEYRTVHNLERRELSDARWSAVLCLQPSHRRSHGGIVTAHAQIVSKPERKISPRA